jgi:hypothetical protein
MLLRGYAKRTFRAECNPNFESLHCIAQFDQDVGEALPYLKASLGGFTYIKEPPSVTFRVHGKNTSFPLSTRGHQRCTLKENPPNNTSGRKN